MPKIREMLLNLEGFSIRYVTEIKYELLSYTSNQIDKQIMYYYPTMGKVQLWTPTNGVSNSLEIFQEKMNEMFCGVEFIRAYIYDLLIITKGDCSDHLDKLKLLPRSIYWTGWSAILKSHSLNKLRWNTGFWCDANRDPTSK